MRDANNAKKYEMRRGKNREIADGVAFILFSANPSIANCTFEHSRKAVATRILQRKINFFRRFPGKYKNVRIMRIAVCSHVHACLITRLKNRHYCRRFFSNLKFDEKFALCVFSFKYRIRIIFSAITGKRYGS